MGSLRDRLFVAVLFAACPVLDAQSSAVAAPRAGARARAAAPARRGLRDDVRRRLETLDAEVRASGALRDAARPATARSAALPSGAGAAAQAAAPRPQAQAQAQVLRWRVNGSSGALSRLRGRLALSGADVSARGSELARRLGPLFDGDAGTRFGDAEIVARDAAGRPTWLRLRQQVQGFPLDGHALLLRLDGDDDTLASEVHGVLRPGAASVPAPRVSGDAARDAALAHLGLNEADLMGTPLVAGRAQIDGVGGLRLVQRVELVARDGLRPLAVDVDAQTGAVLAVRENRSNGTGNLVWNGAPLPFATGKGKGNVYTSVANAIAGKESGAGLSELTVVDVSEEAIALEGTLTGRYATVSDVDAILYSPPRIFSFSDTSFTAVGGSIAQYEAFDHVNAYYWITRMAGWLGKVQGGLSSDTCIPVIVNYDNGGAGYLNAFYSPQDLDGSGGFSPGYFVFGDFDAQTGDPADDFARDPSVVCHEYTHGMADKAGFGFGDEPLDTPARAVNEAIADYAAASFLKDQRIGPVLVAHSGDDLDLPGDALRDLGAPLTLPGNLNDALGFSTGLPEEHEAGEIFGAALWSARAALKPKATDNLILNGLAGWPQGNAEAGFPVVDTDNADDAYAAFDFACFESMMDTLLAPEAGKSGKKLAGKLLGAFLRHGITGTDDDAVLFTFTSQDTAGGLNIAFTSEFLGGISEHRFALDMAPGQVFTLSVTGDKQDGTQVDFASDDGPGDFAYPQAKKQSASGSSASQAKITVNNGGTYVVTVSDSALAGGRYTLKLKLK